jgi:hypothetical protein
MSVFVFRTCCDNLPGMADRCAPVSASLQKRLAAIEFDLRTSGDKGPQPLSRTLRQGG